MATFAVTCTKVSTNKTITISSGMTVASFSLNRR
jgi:hypothetical protein